MWGCQEYRNELAVSIKVREVVDQLSDYYLLKKDSKFHEVRKIGEVRLLGQLDIILYHKPMKRMNKNYFGWYHWHLLIYRFMFTEFKLISW